MRLDATGGFTLATATGGHLAAPTGIMDFDEHNQPRHGHLEGGVQMDSVTAGTAQIHGTSPTAELEFTAQGQLRHAHLERGVEMHSEELSQAARTQSEPGDAMRVSRTGVRRWPMWSSATRDRAMWNRPRSTAAAAWW